MTEEHILEFARAEQASDPHAFRFVPQEYLLRTGGGGFESAGLGWDQALLADLTALRLPGCDPAIAQRVGDALRRFLAPLGFASMEEQLVAASRAGRRAILTIRSAAAELYALPWELLTVKSTGQHLGSLPHVLLRYEWPETRTTGESAAARREGGRVLLAWSAAAGAVPASEHVEAITAACRAGSVTFQPESDILAHVSCSRLVEKLEALRRQGQAVSVLHILCHGSAAGSTFGLALDGEEAGQTAAVVDAGRVRQLLAPFADMVRLVIISACDSGNSGALGNHLGSVAQALHRAGFAAVVASRYPLAVSAAVRLAELLYRELLVETRSLEQALIAGRERLALNASRFDWASVQLLARQVDGSDSRPVVFRPFRGLLSFQPEDRRFFFGRDREVGEIADALGRLVKEGLPRFLVVAGASGSGKSSLVMAGVVPRLLAEAAERGEALELAIRQPGTPGEPWPEAAAPGSRLLLVVNQFEEIFTHIADPLERQKLVQRLWNLARDPESRVTIIATLRVDFIGECGGVAVDSTGRRLDSVAYDQAHRVFVAQLGPEQLRAAIEGPAARVGVALESGLVSRMLEAVGTEPGALPLLSHTLDLLWLRREGRTLTQAGYDAIGQITGALAQHADALLGRMGEAEQRTVHRLMVRLVYLGGLGGLQASRRRVPIERLRPSGQDRVACFERVLEDLVDARLLVSAGDGHGQTVEVAHEALIRGWPRLGEWLKKDSELLSALEKLEALLVQWREHKVLLSGEQLRFAERVLRDFSEDFPDDARPLLRASQREERRLSWLKRGLTVLLLGGTVTFGVLFFLAQRSNARANFAHNELVKLLGKTSGRPSPQEMLRTLARLRLELELRPDRALETLGLAGAAGAQSSQLMADQAEYLLAAGRFAEVGPVAQSAYAAEKDPESCLHIAVVGWSAARFREDRPETALWAERVKGAYEQLPPGARLRSLAGTTELLIRPHSNWPPFALSDILAVFGLLHTEKSPDKPKELEKLL